MTEQDNQDFFDTTYYDELERAVREHPDEYMPEMQTKSGLLVAYTKMLAAFDRESYNKDGRAIKATCRKLGIPHTYKAINAYRRGDQLAEAD